MKICRECKKDRPLSDYYKHKQMLDGHLNKCIECVKSRVKRHRDDNIERIREYDKKRSGLQHRVTARRDYAQTKDGKEAATRGNRAYRKRNPNKYQAHNMVNNAIRDGKLFKEPCEICKRETRVHGHHDDYSKPLNVRWLCSYHHNEWHKEHGEALNP